MDKNQLISVQLFITSIFVLFYLLWVRQTFTALKTTDPERWMGKNNREGKKDEEINEWDWTSLCRNMRQKSKTSLLKCEKCKVSNSPPPTTLGLCFPHMCPERHFYFLHGAFPEIAPSLSKPAEQFGMKRISRLALSVPPRQNPCH